MAQKNAIYQVDNGTGFDEIHFKTNEEMLIGAVQNFSNNGYRKLPGGFIIQWGEAWVTKAGSTIIFPMNFPNHCFTVVGNLHLFTTVSNVNIWGIQSNGFTARQFDEGTQNIKWIAIGF